jgi:hypothetical protein
MRWIKWMMGWMMDEAADEVDKRMKRHSSG